MKIDPKIDALFQLPLDEFTQKRNALAKELSGESAIERARQDPPACACGQAGRETVNLLGEAPEPLTHEQAYLQAAENRFRGVNRCC